MKISLEYFLRKQGITLLSFCKRNKIEDYCGLSKYCNDRRMVPVDETTWKELCEPYVKYVKSQSKVAHDTLQDTVDNIQIEQEKELPKKVVTKKSTPRKAKTNAETNKTTSKTKAPRRKRGPSQKPKK